MNLSLIAAIGKNNELGKNNDLIWHFSEDMKFFRETTIGHTIVMGRKTFESLPHALPKRKNIVITTHDIHNKEIELYKSIKEFINRYKNINEEVFIIGGASIYEQFIEFANKLYLTEINDSKPADVYFPKFNKEQFNKEILSNKEEIGIQYSHVLYKRK